MLVMPGTTTESSAKLLGTPSLAMTLTSTAFFQFDQGKLLMAKVNQLLLLNLI